MTTEGLEHEINRNLIRNQLELLESKNPKLTIISLIVDCNYSHRRSDCPLLKYTLEQANNLSNQDCAILLNYHLNECKNNTKK